jgi:hypothetical protein
MPAMAASASPLAGIDHAAVQRALASLTSILGGIALRIECRRCEEHRGSDASPPPPTVDKREADEAAVKANARPGAGVPGRDSQEI